MNTGTKPRPRAMPCPSLFICVACALVILSPAGSAAAKGWRGIVPLASTRADVERLLGQPAHKGDGWHYYDLRDEAAVVWFDDDKCDPWGLEWDVLAGTVTSIGVLPKRPLKVSALIDTKAAKTESKARDYAVHSDNRAGLTVEAQNGFVAIATYRPVSEDSARRCPELEKYRPREIEHFDVYGRISYDDERARLDNFANSLLEVPSLRAVIFAYGGRRGRPGEAKARGARAKSYLMRVRGIESWRITAIDGGYREELTTQLYAFFIGGDLAPVATPTVAPEEVRFVGRASRRRRPGSKVSR